jgi:hypothetical protein
MDADYMQFKGVMDEVKKRLASCLDKGPATCFDAEQSLLQSSPNSLLSGGGSTGGDTLIMGWMEKTPQQTHGGFFKSAGRDKWKRRFFVLARTSPVRLADLS